MCLGTKLGMSCTLNFDIIWVIWYHLAPFLKASSLSPKICFILADLYQGKLTYVSWPQLYRHVIHHPTAHCLHQETARGFRFHRGALRCVQQHAGQWSESERCLKSDQKVLGAEGGWKGGRGTKNGSVGFGCYMFSVLTK